MSPKRNTRQHDSMAILLGKLRFLSSSSLTLREWAFHAGEGLQGWPWSGAMSLCLQTTGKKPKTIQLGSKSLQMLPLVEIGSPVTWRSGGVLFQKRSQG